jgi:hypothetical protein
MLVASNTATLVLRDRAAQLGQAEAGARLAAAEAARDPCSGGVDFPPLTTPRVDVLLRLQQDHGFRSVSADFRWASAAVPGHPPVTWRATMGTRCE